MRRLYRFPVIFAADAWELLMPHTLQVWAAGKRKFWAEYDDSGVRRCKTYAAVPKDATGRVIRLFGGRKVVDRPDFGGLCDPERCPQYQERQCNLDARLLFIVPGLPTVNLIALPTRSFYSMDGIRQQLLHVASMRGGRLSGYLLGRQTFWLTKVYKDVTRIDDNGDAVKGGAWLIELQAPIDVGSLLLTHEPAQVDAAAQAAATVLEGGVVEVGAPPAVSVDRPEPRPAEPALDARATVKQLRAEVAAALEQYGIEVEAFKRFALETWRSEDWGRSPETLGKATALLKEVGPQLVRLRMLLQGLNVPLDRHALYAARRFRREHWQLQPDTVARAIREAEEHATGARHAGRADRDRARCRLKGEARCALPICPICTLATRRHSPRSSAARPSPSTPRWTPAPSWPSSAATRRTTPSTCTRRRSCRWRASCAGSPITARC